MAHHNSATRIGTVLALLFLLEPLAVAAELRPATVAAFERYVSLTEAAMKGRPAFLRVDAMPDGQRGAGLTELRRSGNLIERLTTTDAGRTIAVPDGIVHHWTGTTFVPGATLEQAKQLLQGYDTHGAIYAPNVQRSRLLARDGNHYRVFLRFALTKVITVVVNSEHAATWSRPAADRAEGWIRSTRIAEVNEPGTPGEAERPVGDDGGYLWRLNSYWRLLARDGGVYVECESISLTRSIPTGFGWLVGPFVTSIPRESLTFTLDRTRDQLTGRVR